MGPQVGEVTCSGLPQVICKRDHIKMRYYMDRRVTPPRRVTSPIWGKSRVLRLLSPSCKPCDLRYVKVLFHAFSVKSDQGSPRRPKGIPVYVMFPVPPSLVITQVKEKPFADSKMAAYQQFLKHIYFNFM